MPWGDQHIMVLPANVLNALAGLHTNSALEDGVTCAAVGWVVAIVSLGGMCVAQCYKERQGNLLPIKVGGVVVGLGCQVMWLAGSKGDC